MKSIERRFKNIEKYNPYWSSCICFTEAIKGQRFSRPIIAKHFNRLIEKDDYDKKDRMEIVKHLILLTNKKVAEESDF